MQAGVYPAMFFTVAMLVTTAYFLMGGLPLLVLQHDTPLDARFVRGFFGVYYKAALLTALGACLGYALWGRLAFAAGALAYALVALALRRRLLPALEALGSQVQAGAPGAVQAFRRLHGIALAVNLAQLVLLVWAITRLSF